jgi:uncharacterized membrane protein YsdA (DUF1294 family)/cold shock CspA family protein
LQILGKRQTALTAGFVGALRRIAVRYQGKITSWKDDRGFGFITPNGGGEQIFVHIKAFLNKQRRPVGNEIVTYELSSDNRRRPRAENVVFVGERPVKAPSSVGVSVSIAFVVLFFSFLTGSILAGKLSLTVLVLYLGVSVVAFLAYALDKSAAKKDQWRTQESTLHLIALICGWPGALVAQKLFHHKSRKQSFQIVFWVTVVLNCVALGWLFTPIGSSALNSIIRLAA